MKLNLLKVLALGLALLLGAWAAAPVAADPPTTAVTGVSDLLGGVIGGELFFDAAGNLHLDHYTLIGGFEVEGDGVDIEGSQTMVLNGVLDESLSGYIAGPYIITTNIGGVNTAIFEGIVHGYLDQLIFDGEANAHGVGPYAGQHLKLVLDEIPAEPGNPNPEIFILIGELLTPGQG